MMTVAEKKLPTHERTRLKRRHNRIKRRVELGFGKPGDDEMLAKLRLKLGYDNERQQS